MILCDSLDDDYPTFPQFQAMLRDYEHQQRHRQEYEAAYREYLQRINVACHPVLLECHTCGSATPIGFPCAQCGRVR